MRHGWMMDGWLYVRKYYIVYDDYIRGEGFGSCLVGR